MAPETRLHLVSTNGDRRPPRPQIEMIGGTASPEEAAAVIAAVEQFLAETSPAPSTTRDEQNPWQRAALLEGVSARQISGGSWAQQVAWRSV